MINIWQGVHILSLVLEALYVGQWPAASCNLGMHTLQTPQFWWGRGGAGCPRNQ